MWAKVLIESTNLKNAFFSGGLCLGTPVSNDPNCGMWMLSCIPKGHQWTPIFKDMCANMLILEDVWESTLKQKQVFRGAKWPIQHFLLNERTPGKWIELETIILLIFIPFFASSSPHPKFACDIYQTWLFSDPHSSLMACPLEKLLPTIVYQLNPVNRTPPVKKMAMNKHYICTARMYCCSRDFLQMRINSSARKFSLLQPRRYLPSYTSLAETSPRHLLLALVQTRNWSVHEQGDFSQLELCCCGTDSPSWMTWRGEQTGAILWHLEHFQGCTTVLAMGECCSPPVPLVNWLAVWVKGQCPGAENFQGISASFAVHSWGDLEKCMVGGLHSSSWNCPRVPAMRECPQSTDG